MALTPPIGKREDIGNWIDAGFSRSSYIQVPKRTVVNVTLGNDPDVNMQQLRDAVSKENRLIKINKGTFPINEWLHITKDNVFIQGAGINDTELIFNIQDKKGIVVNGHFNHEVGAEHGSITFGAKTWRNFDAIYGGNRTIDNCPKTHTFENEVYTVKNVPVKGSKTIELTSPPPAHIKTGSLIWVGTNNVIPDKYYGSVGNERRGFGEIKLVESVNGSIITFYDEIIGDYNILPSSILGGFRVISLDDTKNGSINMVRHGGLSDMKISKEHNDNLSTIGLVSAAFIEIKNVNSSKTSRAHLSTGLAYRCEVKNFKASTAFWYGGETHGYGLSVKTSTSNVFKNMKMNTLRHAVSFSRGSIGNVVVDSDLGVPVRVETDKDKNGKEQQGEKLVTSGGWSMPNLILHGHFPSYNLIENCEIKYAAFSDAVHGACLRGNTIVNSRIDFLVAGNVQKGNLTGPAMFILNNNTSVTEAIETTNNQWYGNNKKGLFIYDVNSLWGKYSFDGNGDNPKELKIYRK